MPPSHTDRPDLPPLEAEVRECPRCGHSRPVTSFPILPDGKRRPECYTCFQDRQRAEGIPQEPA